METLGTVHLWCSGFKKMFLRMFVVGDMVPMMSNLSHRAHELLFLQIALFEFYKSDKHTHKHTHTLFSSFSPILFKLWKVGNPPRSLQL